MAKKTIKSLTFCKASINDLILFSIYSVVTNKKNCTFERLVGESFILFPDIFCFEEHHHWPDARKLDRPLRSLRDQKFIKGNPRTEFTITKEGREKAEEVAKTLRQGKLL